TAANKDMGRGDVVPPLTYTLSGFVNGDSASVVGGSAALSTTATSSSAAARYPIAAGAGSLAATNYEFQFTSGTLTVHPKVLDVRVRWGSKSMSLIGLNRVLPFVNITAVDVVFSDDVTVGNGNLALTSTTAAARTYGFTEFRFNPNTDTASWTLPTALGIDRLMLALDTRFGAQADPTISVWNTIGPVRFGVLPGDIDGNGQVNNQDVGLYKKPPASLLLWLDVDGDGDVDKADEDAVRRRTGTRLP
ncbi:MAG TPA: MBG domain-containing protein, partial [Isosphaeraceae bacterium]